MLQDIFNKYILKPISIVIFLFIAIWFCIESLPDNGQPYTKFIISIVFWTLGTILYCILVFCVNKLPSAPKRHLGVLFVFHAETEELFQDAEFNIRENFSNISNSFKVPLIPICINVNRIKNYSNGNKALMTNLLRKTNCIFCVDVLYQSDDVNIKENYEMKINIGTLHPDFSDEENNILIGELNRMSRPVKNLKFNKDKKLEILRVTATHLNLVAKYIISLVFILEENYTLSDKLLKDLFLFTKGKENWFFDSIRKAYFNSCIGMELLYLDKFHRTDNLVYIDNAEKYLKKMNSLFPNTYGYSLDMAMIDFVKYRNITSAKNHIAICKEIGVSDTWKYSEAFLCAYSGEDISLIIKKYEDAIRTDYNIIEIIDFIENVLVDEPNKYILHLALAMLYHSFGDKKLSAIHLKSFIDNYEIQNQEKYLIKKIAQIRNDKCEVCKFENCDMCNKTA